MAIAHSSTERMRWRTARAVSALTCQMGVRISSTSAVLTSETGRRPRAPCRDGGLGAWFCGLQIELGEKFFQEIIRNPVPLDMNILKALKRSPLGLDLYMWLMYRTFALDRQLRLSWPMLYRQFGVDPSRADDNVTVQRFRRDCLRELKKIQTAWPGLKYRIDRGRRHEKTGALVLLPSAPAIPPRAATG